MATHQHDGAAAPGLVAPDRLPNPEVQTPAVGAGVAGGQGIEDGDSDDSAGSVDSVKPLARLQAELSLQGVELHALKGGGLLAVGPGLKAHFGDLGAAERWAAQRAVLAPAKGWSVLKGSAP